MLSHHPDYKPKEGCGCGRDGAAVDIVPDSFWFGAVDWRPACCIHDDRYKRGGSEADKVDADREFLDNLLWIADGSRVKWYVPTWWARHRAMTYYDAVMRAGAKSFNYHKGENDGSNINQTDPIGTADDRRGDTGARNKRSRDDQHRVFRSKSKRGV